MAYANTAENLFNDLLHMLASGKLAQSSTVARSQLFSVADLKAFKKALKALKATKD